MAIIGSFLPCIFAGTKSVLKIIVTMVSCLNTAWLNDYAWGRDKLLMCFLTKEMTIMNFYRKETYIILWQSRSSPFNFQNLCFFVAKLWDHIILSLNTGNADRLSSTEYMGKQNCFICKMIHVLSFTTLWTLNSNWQSKCKYWEGALYSHFWASMKHDLIFARLNNREVVKK